MRKKTLYCTTVILILTLVSTFLVFPSFATANEEVASTNLAFPSETILPGMCEAVIKLDFQFASNDALKGFSMSNGLHYSDENGVIRAPNRTNDLTRFVIQKPGYLSRTVDLPITSSPIPVVMWAGDINGDECINMLDVRIIASFFNRQVTNNVLAESDFNTDGVINLKDVTIIAAHFGKISSDYPAVY